MGPDSQHLFSVSVAFHFLKCYIWNTYVFLFQYHRKKKKERNKKEKNHKEINKHLLFPDLQLFRLRSACRQSSNKNPKMSVCLHRFLSLYESFFTFYFAFILFCFILFYPRVDPSPSVILLPWICSLQCIFPLSLYTILVFSKVEILFFQMALECSLALALTSSTAGFLRYIAPCCFWNIKNKAGNKICLGTDHHKNRYSVKYIGT